MAATTLQHLLDDVFFEILYRLPVKSLLICKSVCKSWYLLIKSPQFIETHLLHSKAKAEYSLLAVQKTIDDHILAKRFIFKSSVSGGPSQPPLSEVVNLQIPNSFRYLKHFQYDLQLCRGLLCGTTIIRNQCVEVILNPATGVIYELPWRHEYFRLGGFSEIVYDASFGSYKVFWVENHCLSAYVFTLGNDTSWRKVINFPPIDKYGAAGQYDPMDYTCYVFPYLHGVPYFLNGGRRLDQVRALVFVVEKENFFTVDFDLNSTAGILHFRRITTLSAYRGCLYLFDHHENCDVDHFDVWVMKDYENKIWVLEEKGFNLRSVYSNSSIFFDDVDCLYMSVQVATVTDDGIVMKLNCPAGVVYAIYDPRRKVLEKFSISDELKAMGFRVMLADQFAESLVSPRPADLLGHEHPPFQHS